jgi:hypothetical protein
MQADRTAGPVYIIETVAVRPEDRAAMLALIGETIVPLMTGLGLEFRSCLAGSEALGEDVLVQTTWRVDSHAAWRMVRDKLFHNPEWRAAYTEAARLRAGGTWRFFYETGIAGPA